MKSNLFVRIFVLFVLACAVCAVAQDSPMTNITGGGAKNTIPVFTGAHAIGNSIMKQSGGAINVNGGVNATGVIAGSSDVDAGGNVNVTGGVTAGTVLSTNYVQADGEVYAGSFVYSPGDVESPYIYGDTDVISSGGIFGQFLDVNAPSGEGIYAYANDGSQVVQGVQYAPPANNTYEYAFFNNSLSAVTWADSLGDTIAVGSKSAAVPLKNGKMVKVYSQESPQVWFEDFGSAKLMGGVATVKLDSKYAQLVNTKLPYHVFVTPNGDCHGLYVAQKDRNSFEVRELGNGQSSVEFDYRISALRNGYENIRLEPTKVPTVGKEPQHPAHHPPAAPKH